MRNKLLAMLVLASALIAGCGNADPLRGNSAGPADTVLIGSVDFAENKLLAAIYSEVLTRAKIKVKIVDSVASREVAVRALKDSSLTLVPDYTGNLLQFFDKNASQSKSDEVYAALKQKIDPSLEVLAAAPGEDKDVLVVTADTAQRLNIRSMADLGPRCAEFVLAAAGEWKTRWEAKIKQNYNCVFKEIRSTDAGGPITVDALKSGTAQVANLFTTASAIGSNNFVQLIDPKQMYPAQNIVPLTRTGALSDVAKEKLNQISAKITTENLTIAVRRVEIDKEGAAAVAESFVDQYLPDQSTSPTK